MGRLRSSSRDEEEGHHHGAGKGGEASGQAEEQRDADGALAEDDERVDDRH